MPLHNDAVLQVGSSSSIGAMACCWLCKCWLSYWCKFVLLLPVLHTSKTIGFSFPVHVTTSVASPELWFSTKLSESATKTFKYAILVLTPQILFLGSVDCGWCWQCIFPAEVGHLNPKRVEHTLCDLSAVWCPQSSLFLLVQHPWTQDLPGGTEGDSKEERRGQNITQLC